MMAHRCPGIAVLAAVLLIAPIVRAEPSSEDRAAAQGLFDEARDLVKKGRSSEACTKFEESQRLDPGIGTQLYLADCYEKAGRTASAWATFLDAASAAGKAGDKRASVASENAKRLEPAVPRVRVVVPADIHGIALQRDGKPLSTAALSTSLPTDPGQRVFEVSAPGYKTVRIEVTVAPGAKQEVTVPPMEKTEAGAAMPASAPPPNAERAEPASPLDTRRAGLGGMQLAGLATAGLGVIAVGGGVFLGLSARSKNDDAKKSGCRPDGSHCTSDALAQHDDAKSQASLATIAFIAGGVLAAGGATLFVLGSRSSPRSASLSIGPVGSMSDAGVYAEGAF
jgi:hypothetical protein